MFFISIERWISLVKGLLILSTVLLLAGIGLGLKTWIFVSGALVGDATVVDVVEAQRRVMETYYRPILAYQDKNGKSHEVRYCVSSSQPPWRKGARVKILFNQAHPENVLINKFDDIWAPTAVVLGLGVSDILFLSVVFLLLNRAKRKKEK